LATSRSRRQKSNIQKLCPSGIAFSRIDLSLPPLHVFSQPFEVNFICKQRFHRGNDMKNVIALALVVGAVALGACRREEATPAPMKLGAPTAEQTNR
jgi:hypothetical protein